MEDSLRLENPQDERINIPAVRHHYWRYRMQVKVEDLIENYRDFTAEISRAISQSGRG